MSKEVIMEKINEIFRNVFDDDNLMVTETTSAQDIEDWDSLNHITLITSMESTFGMRFALHEITDMKNVGEAAAIIESRMK
jgi:acyl carrier protein